MPPREFFEQVAKCLEIVSERVEGASNLETDQGGGHPQNRRRHGTTHTQCCSSDMESRYDFSKTAIKALGVTFSLRRHRRRQTDHKQFAKLHASLDRIGHQNQSNTHLNGHVALRVASGVESFDFGTEHFFGTRWAAGSILSLRST